MCFVLYNHFVSYQNMGLKAQGQTKSTQTSDDEAMKQHPQGCKVRSDNGWYVDTNIPIGHEVE